MSASTVSIRANPPSRRRPVLSTERKAAAATSIELLGLDPNSSIYALENGDAGAGDDNRVSSISGRDLRPSLVLDRAKDTIQVNELLPNGVPSPRRTRRVIGKPAKPVWLTLVSVFVKNCVLLVVLLGLVQLIYRLAAKSGDGNVGVEVGSGPVMELEGRLAEMEKTWKKTAKMMQVQVEVVDAKFGNEILGLRQELSQRMEDRSAILENELHRLDAKFENLETILGQLRLDGFLTKEELHKFYENLKNAGNDGIELSLDEVRAYAREVVEREIEKHAADGLGRVDYALASGGAKVVKHSEPLFIKKGSWLKMTLGRNSAHEDAEKMLKPSFGEPGQCFPLRGSSGFVQIQLRTAIIPEAITLEHVSKSVAYDRSSAPKDCRVSGWLEEPRVDSEVNAEKRILLSEFSYDLDRSSAQTFPVSESAGGGLVNMVRLDFTSNHGSPSHTCIYRVRVHGQEPTSISKIELQS
uniref:SUN domain-containing protein n=1 Tax=Kalanchoe fedtschenkoi TaxID=63787 RepID=A0A7N0T5P1_KALFE